MKVLIKLVRTGTSPMTVQVNSLAHSELARAARTAGLLSRDPDFEVNEDGISGDIFVGGLRKVGTWEVTES